MATNAAAAGWRPLARRLTTFGSYVVLTEPVPELLEQINCAAGYSGNGVGPSWLGGQILPRLALGADDELTRLPLVNRRIRGLPPEPVKHLGGALVRGALLRVEESEQAGRRPPLAARW